MIRKYRVIHIFRGCLLIRSLVWGNVGEMVQLHGKSAGMVSPRGKALDPAHSDSQRLSLALFPALGTSQAAADAVEDQ